MDLYSLLLSRTRYRQFLWLLTLAVTVLLTFGMTHLRVETGILDWLPARHPNVQAFRRLFQDLQGAVHQELIWLEIDAEKSRRLEVSSITDPVSFLAQQELVTYLRQRVPEIRGDFGILSMIRVANTIGGNPAQTADSLPEPTRIRVLWEILARGAPNLVNSIIASDPSTSGTVMALIMDSPPMSPAGRASAGKLEDALRSYADDPQIQYDLFVDEYLVPVGLSSGIASIDRLLIEDLVWLSPLAILILLIVLRRTLGSWQLLWLVFAQLGVGIVWTMGFMGWLGTPINIITFALIPLILGCGIDYSILISLDALDRRTRGLSSDDTLTGLRSSAALAVLLTTLTTSAGLLTLTLSDSIGMAALGLHAALGMLSLAFLSTLILPALLIRMPPGKPSRLGPVIASLALSFARNRSVVLLVVATATVAAVVLVRKPVFLLDVIEGNYPSNSAITRSVARVKEKCGGSFPEIIIAQGDLSSRSAMKALIDVERDLAASETFGSQFRTVGAPDILGIYLLLSSGSPLEANTKLLKAGGDVKKIALDNHERIQEVVSSMHSDPLWSPVASMFFDPEVEVATILLLGGDAGADLRSVEKVWTELQSILAKHETAKSPLKLSFLGYRTMSYLFADYSMKWIRVTLLVSLGVVTLLSAVFLRERRAVFVIITLMGVSGLWWFALLQMAGIYMSIFLLFPLVFALCIGSDYGLHMICRLRADRLALEEARQPFTPLVWTRSAWESTGRAIAIAALTDGAIFLLFSAMDLVSASRVMLAVALAVGAVFSCTILLLPALAFPKRVLLPEAEEPE